LTAPGENDQQVPAGSRTTGQDTPGVDSVACDAALAERIRAVNTASDATYGVPRVTAELREAGAPVNPVSGLQAPCWCFGLAGAVSRIL
jgi:hypothetical protein